MPKTRFIFFSYKRLRRIFNIAVGILQDHKFIIKRGRQNNDDTVGGHRTTDIKNYADILDGAD